MWKVSGKVYKWKEFQAVLPNVPHIQGEKAQQLNESAWGHWTGWCNGRKVNPFQAPANYINNFLSEKLDKGLQYRTLNCSRSAISAYHVHIDSKSVEKHLKDCVFLAAIFNKRPPQPGYVFYMGCADTGMTIHYLMMQT